MGLATFAIGLPAPFFIKERSAVAVIGTTEWRLFKDIRFSLMFVVGAIATFPLLVPAFFLPLYSSSLGLSAGTGAALLAGFKFSLHLLRASVGQGWTHERDVWLSAGQRTGHIGFVADLDHGWPPSRLRGAERRAANGGFFSTVPTVVGDVFGSARVVVALGMIVTGWAGGYLMVCFRLFLTNNNKR